MDGTFIRYESATIVEYLEDKYPAAGAPLWPKDCNARALARRIAAEASGYVYPHVRTLVVELLMRGKFTEKHDRFFIRPDDIAGRIVMLTRQNGSAWTFELEVRPFSEIWRAQTDKVSGGRP